MGHLDWLSFSIPYHENPLHNIPEHDAFLFDANNPVKPLPRYERAFRLACGGLYCLPNKQNASQKRLIQLTGDNCRKAREMGLTDDNLIWTMFDRDGRPSRTDYAFDTDNPEAKVSDVWSAWEKGKIKTKLQEAELTSKKGRKGEPANTVYLGSKASEQRVVVYDKAKQMNLLNEAWVRVELRLYGSAARRAAFDALKHADIDKVARQKVRNIMRTPIEWLENMIAGGDVELTALLYEKDIWKWLNHQVKPAIDEFANAELDQQVEMARWLFGRLNAIMPDWHEMGWHGKTDLDGNDIREAKNRLQKARGFMSEEYVKGVMGNGVHSDSQE